MKPIQFSILVTVVALFAGCATTTPQELIDARAAYQHASAGSAAQLVPAELHKAHEALLRAEQSFEKDANTYRTRDLSYVAQRKSQLAEALGAIAADKASKAKADAAFEKKQTEIVKQGKDDLVDSEKRAADAKVASDAAAETARRDLIDSEKRTADALAELAKLAAVKEEERGLVITLSGSVLFQTDESILMPSAQVKLNQVTRALLAVKKRSLIVEGHTDSQGSDSHNQGLSQRRADAVRDYLVQGGYPADHLQSRGMGESHPVADNASPEGRANNRRVEIIIERESQASSH